MAPRRVAGLGGERRPQRDREPNGGPGRREGVLPRPSHTIFTPSLMALHASEEAMVQARPMHTMSSESDTATRSERNGAIAPLLIAAAIGAAVSVSLGVYGRVHDPTGEQIAHFGFSSTLSMKAWLGTGVAVLAVAQAGTAAWMWGRLPGFGRAPGGPRICTAGRVRRRPRSSPILLVDRVPHRRRVIFSRPSARSGALTTKLLALRICTCRAGVPCWAARPPVAIWTTCRRAESFRRVHRRFTSPGSSSAPRAPAVRPVGRQRRRRGAHAVRR